MLRLGSFERGIQENVSTTAATFTNDGTITRFVLLSTVNVHIARTTAAQAAYLEEQSTPFTATQTDTLLNAGMYALIAMLPGDVLSYVVDSADTDGVLYITPVTEV